MAWIQRFVFCFSLRIGTIVIGILSLIQASIWLMISMIAIKNEHVVRDFLLEIIDSLSIHNKHFLAFAEDPRILLNVLSVFAGAYLVTCVLVLAGTYMCRPRLLFPFLLMDMVYIICVMVLMILLLINFKKRGFGLGALLIASNVGTLILMTLIYMWLCVASLVQIITEVHEDIAEQGIFLEDGPNEIIQMVDQRYHQELQSDCYETTEC